MHENLVGFRIYVSVMHAWSPVCSLEIWVTKMFYILPCILPFYFQDVLCSSQNLIHSSGEQGMVDEAQKALEEAEALKKVLDF